MATQPAFRIYHVPGTRSMRVLWLCAELDVPIEVVVIDFGRDYRFSPEWLARNPLGKVPAMDLLDANGRAITMFESGAMVEVVLDRAGSGRLRPAPGSDEHALYLQWSWFAEATFARPLGDIMQHTRIKPPEQRLPAMVEDGKARARLCLGAIEAVVAKQPYLLASGFSAADIHMGWSLMLASNTGVLDAAYPNCRAYFERLTARPSYAKANG